MDSTVRGFPLSKPCSSLRFDTESVEDLRRIRISISMKNLCRPAPIKLPTMPETPNDSTKYSPHIACSLARAKAGKVHPSPRDTVHRVPRVDALRKNAWHPRAIRRYYKVRSTLASQGSFPHFNRVSERKESVHHM